MGSGLTPAWKWPARVSRPPPALSGSSSSWFSGCGGRAPGVSSPLGRYDGVARPEACPPDRPFTRHGPARPLRRRETPTRAGLGPGGGGRGWGGWAGCVRVGPLDRRGGLEGSGTSTGFPFHLSTANGTVSLPSTTPLAGMTMESSVLLSVLFN